MSMRGERLRPRATFKNRDDLSIPPSTDFSHQERKNRPPEATKRSGPSGPGRFASVVKRTAAVTTVVVGCAVCAAVPWYLQRSKTSDSNEEVSISSSLKASLERTRKNETKPQINSTANLDGTRTRRSAEKGSARRGRKRLLTIYAQSSSAGTLSQGLERYEFAQYENDCSRTVPWLPVDANAFPTSDPFLPWIHDYFVSYDGARVHFVAQNKRRCQTGHGMERTMKHWEPQLALFQPVPVREVVESTANTTTRKRTLYALATPESATYPETRFLCSFQDQHGNSAVTFSTYPFNYEYISWRKGKAMFVRRGKDVDNFEFSTLLFRCPIPASFRHLLVPSPNASNKTTTNPPPLESNQQIPQLWLDVVPLRTQARSSSSDGFLLTEDHVGPTEYAALRHFDVATAFGTNSTPLILPPVEESGRWSNLAICPPKPPSASAPTPKALRTINQNQSVTEAPPLRVHNLVLCTWTSASYKRRGDAVFVDDAALRLREWIVFHRMVGVDHIYLYDNTQLSPEIDSSGESPLRAIVGHFPSFVTLVPWPYQVCSNNRPNYKNPGERSSQYAAEASCRERFGPHTEWMSFLDTDEYLVPLLNGATNWTEILRARKQQGYHVLKMRSARGKPRVDLMEPIEDEHRRQILCPPSTKPGALREEPCIVPRRNETFLRVYNCNYIRPPLPDRFSRAMKQIYRPSFVYSHFVHYSTVTAPMARYYKDWNSSSGNDSFSRRVTDHSYWGDVFLNDENEAILVHTKSVLPHETMVRSATCHLGSKHTCNVGYACPASTAFVDADHKKNVFHDASGNFCNCWVHDHVETVLGPMLEAALT